jgi:3-hydroxyacyl-CoA dehydrogenase / enoyl-CoA hydratase / 3-hydroxybutyryl-CoA epimerase
MTATFEHWRQRIDEQGICWLTFDKASSSANTLSQAVLDELAAIVDGLSAGSLRGVVFESGKSNGFIAGADVKEFAHVDSAEQGTALAERGQRLMARIAALKVPTVAAIDGYALGGGLELALACDYRVVADGYERTLGLPEVQLGIHPGFGGTVRAVSLLGPLAALGLMLTGRALSPREARAAGLVDRVVPRENLRAAAADLTARRPLKRRAPWYLSALNAAPCRPLLAYVLSLQVRRRARRAHYPAPYAIIELWKRYGAHGTAAYRAEAVSIGELIVTRTAKNLVRVFELRERLRNLAPKDAGFKRVHVVGSGIMGGDIAAWCALRGLTVTVQDRAQQYVDPAIKRARELFQRRLHAPGEAEAAAARLSVDLRAERIGDADLVIEAIIEDANAKRELFRELESKLGAGAIVATNTSSIRLEELVDAFRQPGRFVGLHFFNPVASLPLVEVIKGEQTDDTTVQKALSFVTQIGKLPLPCRSAPGFLVNRLLTPYMLEALYAHEDGVALETIDAAARGFGMPMGPIELADRVGLDVALHVAKILGDTLAAKPSALLEGKVAARELGRKTGRGFYAYDRHGRPKKQRKFARGDDRLVDRLILPLVNEAVACYAERIVSDLDLVDAGVVFGTGFAPFTGGPIQYARQRGFKAVVEALQGLEQQYGTRFTPQEGWRELLAET